MVDDSTRIRVIRALLGLSKREFADLLEVTENTVGNWEAGRNVPQRRHRERMAAICAEKGIILRTDGYPAPAL